MLEHEVPEVVLLGQLLSAVLELDLLHPLPRDDGNITGDGLQDVQGAREGV